MTGGPTEGTPGPPGAGPGTGPGIGADAAAHPALDLAATYAGRDVLVTGGLGFIGSHLARRLVALGARVTILDSLFPEYGGNLHNIRDIAGQVTVNIADVRNRNAVEHLLRGREWLFNLAGQVSHIDSMKDPFTDLAINCTSQLSLLEAARNVNRDVRVVLASSRQQYGRPEYLPVDERHPVRPVDVNGINKVAGELYHLVYDEVYGIRSTSLRLTNTYGPGQLVKHNRQGFIGWFIRLAVEGRTIQVYGDGDQLRDLNHVDDVATALLLAGATDSTRARFYNLAGEPPMRLGAIAELLVELSGRGAVEYVPWPEEKKRIDIGHYYGSAALITRELGWRPLVPLREGLEATVRFYAEHLEHYL